MRKFIREPLIHFLLLGAVIFFIAGRSRSIAVPSGEKIVITQSQIESILVGFSRTWMRPPTREELQGLVNDYVRDEVLYREARTMGLDQDDVIVRRRMRQKFEFLVEDMAARTGPPSDQELEAYLRQHADKYRDRRQVQQGIGFSRIGHGRSLSVLERACKRLFGGKRGKPTAQPAE